MQPTNRPHELYAEAEFAAPPVEVFNIEDNKHKLLASDDEYVGTVRSALDESISYLPFFAEKYQISSDIKDYVLVPVTAFLSDVPNKKGHCFDYEELVSADPYLGTIKYKTWKHMPTHIDHQNKDFTKAKGIILESSLVPAKGLEGDLYKLILLQAFDRRTYPEIGNNIITGKWNTYSMGANASSFKCSICSSDEPHRCGHIPKGMLDGSGFEFPIIEGQVGYLRPRDIKGFENSVLSKNNPANPVSVAQQNSHMTYK